MTPHHHHDLIGLFAQHRVAANLLMLTMILAGVFALSKLNTQFAPNFDPRTITVRIVWDGASAEDIASSITAPVEQALRNLDSLKRMTSTSANSLSLITLEFKNHADMSVALDQTKERIALLRNLPATAEKPEISKVLRYELVARLLLTGSGELAELRPLVRRFERELLERGIAKIEPTGLPAEEIAVQIPIARLAELGLTLSEAGQRIAAESRDLPAGMVGREDVARQLRGLEQRRGELAFLDIPLAAGHDGRLLRLGEVSEIERRPRQGEARVEYRGRPAVELALYRAEHSDALAAAEILHAWLEQTRSTLPAGLALEVYDETWVMLAQRIDLMVENGLSGLVLIVAILFLFLHSRVAWWVAVGVPVSLLAMLAVLHLAGGSINMYSLFAMIMALGLVVDDAIVVGEDAWARYQRGSPPLLAAEEGARRMLPVVTASSLTTIAAFLPLMLIGGMLGNMVFDIPLVVISVLVASLVECFLVLPGHLRHGFARLGEAQAHPWRQRLDRAFDSFKEKAFRPLVRTALRWHWATLAVPVALLILGIGLLAGGRLNFTFMPDVESSTLSANVTFVAGTPPERIAAFVRELETSLAATDAELGPGLVRIALARHGLIVRSDWEAPIYGEQYASLMVELRDPESRTVRSREFIRAWQDKIAAHPGMESFGIRELRTGPPGLDIDISLSALSTGSGNQVEQLKAAALELQAALKTVPGVSAVQDDLFYGREQLIYRLRPEAVALGLDVAEVGRQLRAAYDGWLAQIFLEQQDEIEVRVVLPDHQRHDLSSLGQFQIRLPAGNTLPLADVVNFEPRRGFDTLHHHQGRLAVRVMADVDEEIANANQILAKLSEEVLPGLQNRYGIAYSLEGRAADQAETFGDLGKGLLLGLALMYLILAGVFGGYGWPLLVMAVIPFSLVGALFGHWLFGIDLTAISLMGLFGLSGVVVNDSIVLVKFYQDLRDSGEPIRPALEEAACQRLRAVLLTSLTTLGGLLPLLLETSWQAQFLIPMAVSLSFGLLFSTVLVLLVLPALLATASFSAR
jgi:multidrug efflux pump subunit AcrB